MRCGYPQSCPDNVVVSPTAETTAPPEYGFANRLERARERRGVTQRELAFRAGTGQSHVINLERDRKAPWVTTIWKMAQALAVDPVWLAFGHGGDVPEPTEVHFDEYVVRQAFPARAKFARLAADLKQRELAEKLGIHQANVSALENGVQGATIGTLHGYVEALGCPPGWIMSTSEVIEPWRS